MHALTPFVAEVLADEIERKARHHAERPLIPDGLRPRPWWRRAR
jgi:hypothetical protein